jgi:hypothetical protein
MHELRQVSAVTCPFKARIVEPEGTAVARVRLSKHSSAAIYARNNRRNVGDVFYAVSAEAIYRGPTEALYILHICTYILKLHVKL